MSIIGEVVAAAARAAEREFELPERLEAYCRGLFGEFHPGLVRITVTAEELGTPVLLLEAGFRGESGLALSEAGDRRTSIRLGFMEPPSTGAGEELALTALSHALPWIEEHYADPLGRLKVLLSEARTPTSRMATAAAHLHAIFTKYTWVGFYMIGDDPAVLEVGPYCGFPTCTAAIPVERGMCGRCFTEDRILNIPDIHGVEGYISCHGSTVSELVLPVRSGGRTIGVFDLDGAIRGAFTTEDEQLLGSALELIFPD